MRLTFIALLVVAPQAFPQDGEAAIAGAGASRSGPAAAQDAAWALTPPGEATLRQSFLGPSPAIGYGPRVIVSWSVEVGRGGRAGLVALRTLRAVSDTTAAGGDRSDFVTLPEAPGRYAFASRIRFEDGDVLGLDQRTGGHAVIRAQAPDVSRGPSTDPAVLHVVDRWTPPLEPGARRAYDERLQARQVTVAATFEGDRDRDGYGDQTQDANSLSVRAVGRRVAGAILVRAVVRNRGERRVDRPRLLLWGGGGSWTVVSVPRCPGTRLLRCWWPEARRPGAKLVSLPPLPDGARHVVRLRLVGLPRDRRAFAAAESEGPARLRRTAIQISD